MLFAPVYLRISVSLPLFPFNLPLDPMLIHSAAENASKSLKLCRNFEMEMSSSIVFAPVYYARTKGLAPLCCAANAVLKMVGGPRGFRNLVSIENGGNKQNEVAFFLLVFEKLVYMLGGNVN